MNEHATFHVATAPFSDLADSLWVNLDSQSFDLLPHTVTAQAARPDLLAARDGDRAALERVLAGSRRDLRRYAEHHCIVNDIEDAVQESLLSVSAHIRQLRAVEAFNSWLFRIVKRECNRMKRSMRRLAGEPIPEEILAQEYPPRPDLIRDLSACLQLLPAHYREALLLRDLHGLNLNELAATLGLSREAAKARLHRARVMARQFLHGSA